MNVEKCRQCLHYEKYGTTLCGFTTHHCYKHNMAVEQMCMLHMECKDFKLLEITTEEILQRLHELADEAERATAEFEKLSEILNKK